MKKEQLEIQQIKQAYQKRRKKIKTIKIKPKGIDLIAAAEANLRSASLSKQPS